MKIVKTSRQIGRTLKNASRLRVIVSVFARHGFYNIAERIKLVNGAALRDPADLVARLRTGGWLRGYCDPALWPQLGSFFGPDFKVEHTFDRTRVDDYSFGITRASGAIAETGMPNSAAVSAMLLEGWALMGGLIAGLARGRDSRGTTGRPNPLDAHLAVI